MYIILLLKMKVVSHLLSHPLLHLSLLSLLPSPLLYASLCLSNPFFSHLYSPLLSPLNLSLIKRILSLNKYTFFLHWIQTHIYTDCLSHTRTPACYILTSKLIIIGIYQSHNCICHIRDTVWSDMWCVYNAEEVQCWTWAWNSCYDSCNIRITILAKLGSLFLPSTLQSPPQFRTQMAKETLPLERLPPTDPIMEVARTTIRRIRLRFTGRCKRNSSEPRQFYIQECFNSGLRTPPPRIHWTGGATSTW